MRIDLRDERQDRLGRVEINPQERPTRVRPEGFDREVFLNWEAALNDAGYLRRCVACGCKDLYVQRLFPQLTGFVVVLAFVGAAIGIFGGGLAENPFVLTALVLVLIADVASFVFRKRRLVCYHCRTSYSQTEIAGQHKAWDRAFAQRHARPELDDERPPATRSVSTRQGKQPISGSVNPAPARKASADVL